MSLKNDLIQLDDTPENIQKFKLSNQVPNIIGKEEQDFKLSMSFLTKQPNVSNNQVYETSINLQNNSNIFGSQNNIQNQSINNQSQYGQTNIDQKECKLDQPKPYELDLEQTKYDLILSPNNMDFISNIPSYQGLDNEQNNLSQKIDGQIDQQNNINQFNSSSFADQTSQTFKFLNVRTSPQHEKFGLQLNEYNMKQQPHQRESTSSQISKSQQQSYQIIKINEKDSSLSQLNVKSKESSISNKNKGTFYLMKMAYVKSFISKLIKSVRGIMFKKITRQQFELIDDFASDFNYYVYQNHLIYSEVSFIITFLFILYIK